MNRKTAIGIGGGAAGIALFATLAVAMMSDPPPPIPLWEVEEKPYLRQVTAEGNLKAVKATPLSAPAQAQGPLKIGWIADDGVAVKSGDVIVSFDGTDFERDLLEGQEERSRTGNRIEGAEADAGATRTNLGRDARIAQRELESAQSFQITDEEIFSRFELIESGIDEGLAVEKKEYAEQMRLVRDQLFQAERDLLGIDERKAGHRIDRASKGLSSLEVVAPHDGILVLTRNWRGELPRVGSSVWSGFPIGEIPELGSMKVEAYVLEADAGGISEGQEAEVVVESYPDRKFKAKVEKVDPIAKPRFRGSPVQYFGVTLAIDETDPKIMKPGSRVHATITLEKSDAAIAIPRQAIFDQKGKKIVHRWTGSGFEAVEVELGNATVGSIAVKKGLEPGDQIALKEPEAVSSKNEDASGEK